MQLKKFQQKNEPDVTGYFSCSSLDTIGRSDLSTGG